jgi:hypothetical protein
MELKKSGSQPSGKGPDSVVLTLFRVRRAASANKMNQINY